MNHDLLPMNPIITLTMNPAVDISSTVEEFVANHKLRCQGVRNDAGGGGINVSRVIHELGGETEAVYCAGGPTGDLLQVLLSHGNVPQRRIPIEGWTRQDFTILELSSNQQLRFILPGPELRESEWREALCLFQERRPFPNYVVASGSLPPGVSEDFYGMLANIVRRCGGKLILDASGSALAGGLKQGVYMIKPSLRELRALSGETLSSRQDQIHAARRLISDKKCEVVVLSLGAEGALLVQADFAEHFVSPSAPVHSCVGAGDSMVGGIVQGLASGMEVRAAVQLGIAAGAAAVMNYGTQLCRRADVEELYNSCFKPMQELSPVEAAGLNH